MTATATGFAPGAGSVVIQDHETLTIAVTADAIPENGGSTTTTVTRSNANIAEPLTVTLAASQPDQITMDQVVTIPAGAASVEFTITAVDDALLDGTQTTTISASALGYVSIADNLDVIDFEPLRVTAFTRTASGFQLQFHGSLATTAVNLYDGAGGTLGPADVVLLDGAGQAVAGSLVVDDRPAERSRSSRRAASWRRGRTRSP